MPKDLTAFIKSLSTFNSIWPKCRRIAGVRETINAGMRLVGYLAGIVCTSTSKSMHINSCPWLYIIKKERCLNSSISKFKHTHIATLQLARVFMAQLKNDDAEIHDNAESSCFGICLGLAHYQCIQLLQVACTDFCRDAAPPYVYLFIYACYTCAISWTPLRRATKRRFTQQPSKIEYENSCI